MWAPDIRRILNNECPIPNVEDHANQNSNDLSVSIGNQIAGRLRIENLQSAISNHQKSGHGIINLSFGGLRGLRMGQEYTRLNSWAPPLPGPSLEMV